MRKNVALTIEDKRKIQNEAAEQKRIANIQDVEAERARQNEIRR